MKTHELLRRVFKRHGCKTVAAALGVTLGTVHKWSRPPEPAGTGVKSPLDYLEQLWDATGDEELVQWFCRRAGGRFVRGSEMPPLVRRWWEQLQAEMESLLRTEGQKQKAEGLNCLTGGSRCRYRLPSGRCGFVAGRGRGQR